MPDKSTCTTAISPEIDLDCLVIGLSPRFGEPDLDHAQVLANTFDDCPPILVERTTSTVIDGVHRLLAARMLGRGTVAVRYFDGSHEEAFAEAVRANIAHGKPLTLAEREQAAIDILKMGSEWSDRRLGTVCGLSDKTIGRLRKRTAEIPQLSKRVGRDGRLRPTDSEKQRTEIAAALNAQPDAKPDEIARALSTSPNTVRDVRDRLRNGDRPESSRRMSTTPPAAEVKSVPGERSCQHKCTTRLWKSDQALLSMPGGEVFTAWLDQATISSQHWEPRITHIPLGRIHELADDARARAEEWATFATSLEERARDLTRKSRR
jgi:ParB-like chromosome segregation protein Spo0J